MRAATIASLLFIVACSPDAAGEVSLALADDERYTLGQTQTYALYEEPEVSVFHCPPFTNGVVRSWHVYEKNKYDFRWSKHYCRNMEDDGTLGSTYDFRLHFYNSGNGTYGISKIPLTSLPVGVRLRVKERARNSISNVALLYDDAADIFAGMTSFSQAPWALGHSAGTTRTLRCGRGEVMRNLDVQDVPQSGGPNQSRIANVYIGCATLDVVPR